MAAARNPRRRGPAVASREVWISLAFPDLGRKWTGKCWFHPLLPHLEEETLINRGGRGKVFQGGREKSTSHPGDLRSFVIFLSFRRPGGDYSPLFVRCRSDDISTLCAEWCIIQKWQSNGRVETKYGFCGMKNLTAATPPTAWNIL